MEELIVIRRAELKELLTEVVKTAMAVSSEDAALSTGELAKHFGLKSVNSIHNLFFLRRVSRF